MTSQAFNPAVQHSMIIYILVMRYVPLSAPNAEVLALQQRTLGTHTVAKPRGDIVERVQMQKLL
jgi:hypothetical protein